MNPSKTKRYQLNESGEFIITDYNSAKLFSSFFPGVAGENGIPMWVFYVNRGQGICSMGIQDKQHPIMEFLPANWAYNLASSQGFRTFLKFADKENTSFYEPFQNYLRDNQLHKVQRLIITSYGLKLEEINHTLQLKFTVEYFNVPQASYAGLVRRLQIENLADEPISFSGLDGLPLIIPYGINNDGLKHIRRLVEAFVEVVNLEKNAPFFRSKVVPADRPEVHRIEKGNFYFGFTNNDARLVPTIVDPVKIFGIRGDYNYPESFLKNSESTMKNGQIIENRLPCAMGSFQADLLPGENFVFSSIIGHTGSVEQLNDLIPQIANHKYLDDKAKQNEAIIKKITQNNFICSQQTVLNRYVRQNFLDNTLRGGYPFTLNSSKDSTSFHLYSRKHGDLERDYNDYQLKPTPYSQGNGNFRDVNQNRRCDLFFNPEIRDGNVEHFYDLIQLDGFNPLVIKEMRFTVRQREELAKVIEKFIDSDNIEEVASYLEGTFTPGELLSFLSKQKIAIKGEIEKFLADLLVVCKKIYATEYGESYWTDHWTYNLDLLENFLAIYPDEKESILFQKRSFSFYDNPFVVKPRNEKYVIWKNKPMQLNAVKFDEEKETLINSRNLDPNKVRTQYGKGEIFQTTLAVKMLTIIVNKLASLDSHGVGVEMETDKPNWYDALNGLPALMGSSINETLEIKRSVQFLLKAIKDFSQPDEKWLIFLELHNFMQSIYKLLQTELTEFEFWDKATTAKEEYRAITRMGISGELHKVEIKYIIDFLEAALKKLDAGIDKAWDKDKNVICSYFVNELTDYEPVNYKNLEGKRMVKLSEKGLPCIRAKKFEHKPLPLFLEGPVHYLRSHIGNPLAKEMVGQISKSGLFDDKMRMYKVNEKLVSQPPEIGRARTFSPGWFENESIWLHMEYKYMLELLRNGFYEQFFQDARNVFVPFMDPEIYGRSILENSSFIVSSANPDPSIHGNGYVARLSGATAEFISIMSLMSMGRKPFSVGKNGELQFNLQPVIPGWLFTEKETNKQLYLNGKWQQIEFAVNSFSFMFLGKILVIYNNKKRKNTFGTGAVTIKNWQLTDNSGLTMQFASKNLSGEIAERIRNREIQRIEVELA